MQSIFNSAKTIVLSLINIFLANILGIFGSLFQARDRISTKHLMNDFGSVLFSAGMILVFQVLAAVVFIVLPPGKDVIMVTVEDMKNNGELGNIAGLIFGTIAWSLFSEFAVRYAIYVTDNSAQSLGEQRVGWRKAVQQAVADMFLILPYLIVLASLYANYHSLSAADQFIYLSSFRNIAIMVYLIMVFLTMIYFAGRNAKKRALARLPASNQPGTWIDQWLDRLNIWCCHIYERVFPNESERSWCERLKGIYNDHIFELRKWSQFRGDARQQAHEFSNLFLLAPVNKRHRFPQDTNFVDPSILVPACFVLRKLSTDGEMPGDDTQPGRPDGFYRWQYYIPNSFYRRTHRWLFTLVGAAIAWFIIILFLHSNDYESIGSPGLVMGAFCVWTGLYIGVLYLDYGVLRRGRPSLPASPEHPIAKYPSGWRGGAQLLNWLQRTISVRVLLLMWLVLASLKNVDHPVRYVLYSDDEMITHPEWNAGADTRPQLTAHFSNWLAHYVADTHHCYYDREKKDTMLPVTFLCAEGGALRTGAFTSLMLGLLQDSLCTVRGKDFDFSKSVYACSGVSGGSLGLACFNAVAYLDEAAKAKGACREQSREFFTCDFLAPVIGKLFYGDILQLWWPWHVAPFDRAISLEYSWEKGYERIHSGNSIFSRSMFKLYQGMHPYPAFFINTTEVETGMQCWLSNVRPNGAIYDPEGRDLLGKKLLTGIRLSTAVNFSTRFPLISPGVCVRQSPSQKYHYVDGGYIENTGAATMLEILDAIRPTIDSYARNGIRIYPQVLMMRFGQPAEGTQDISFANEFTEILYGMYNTRAGRVNMAQESIRRYFAANTGQDGRDTVQAIANTNNEWGAVIQLQLKPDGKQVPMNWILSHNSLQHLDQFIDGLWRLRRANSLASMVFVDTARYVQVR